MADLTMHVGVCLLASEQAPPSEPFFLMHFQRVFLSVHHNCALLYIHILKLSYVHIFCCYFSYEKTQHRLAFPEWDLGSVNMFQIF